MSSTKEVLGLVHRKVILRKKESGVNDRQERGQKRGRGEGKLEGVTKLRVVEKNMVSRNPTEYKNRNTGCNPTCIELPVIT